MPVGALVKVYTMKKDTSVVVTLCDLTEKNSILTLSDHEITVGVERYLLTTHTSMWAFSLLETALLHPGAKSLVVRLGSDFNPDSTFSHAVRILLSGPWDIHSYYNVGESCPSDVKRLSGRPRTTSIRKVRKTSYVLPERLHIVVSRWLQKRIYDQRSRGIKSTNFSGLHEVGV